jgi:hypothetical protein
MSTKGEQKRRPKKKHKARRGFRWPVLAAAGGGGLLLILVLVLIIFLSRGRGPAVKSDKDTEVNLPITECPASPSKIPTAASVLASARTPQAGAWKVTPDGLPLLTDLPSAFTCDLPFVIPFAPTLHFSGPEKAQAAVIWTTEPASNYPKIRWFHYDLRRAPDPIASVELDRVSRDFLPRLAGALSPNGERLALSYGVDAFTGSADKQAPHGFRVHFWSPDGKRLGSLPNLGRPCEWVAFADDARLLTFNGDRIGVWEAPSGKSLGTAQGSYKLPVVLSPGRQWVVANRGDGLDVLRSADGTVAGRLDLPPGIGAVKDNTGVAFSPDGKQLAVCYTGQHDVFLLFWDMADGRLRQVLVMPGSHMAPVSHDLEWCGPRSLFLSDGLVIDLDVGCAVLDLSKGWKGCTPVAPDGRFWRVQVVEGEMLQRLWKDLKGKVPPPRGEQVNYANPPPRRDAFLCASRVPVEALARRLQPLAGGLVFTRSQPIRAEVQGEGEDYRAEAARKLVDKLTERGFTLDPATPITMRLKFPPPSIKKVTVSSDSSIGRGIHIKGLGGADYAFAFAEARLELLDAHGRVVWTSNPLVASKDVARWNDKAAIDAKFAGEAAKAREQLLKEVLEKDFPKLFDGTGGIPHALVACDADGRQVRLPLRQDGLGIDGYPEPPMEEFRLPGER